MSCQCCDCTSDNTIVCHKRSTSIGGLINCNHEEADTRMFVHANHAAASGAKTILVKANDTDVLVIAISIMSMLKDLGVEHLQFEFGQGHNIKWIPVHEISASLGQEKSTGISFSTLSLAATLFLLFVVKKKAAWQTWNVCPESTAIFHKLSQYTLAINEEDIRIIEKFVITMYVRYSITDYVDEARFEMFARKQRSYDSIPPTKAALIQHIKRAAYQAGCICQITIKSPSD